jgi:hypothetical protein
VSQSHQLVHPDILLLVVGNFEEIQNYFVNAHVAEQALLVFARFDALFKHLMFCNIIENCKPGVIMEFSKKNISYEKHSS